MRCQMCRAMAESSEDDIVPFLSESNILESLSLVLVHD